MRLATDLWSECTFADEEKEEDGGNPEDEKVPEVAAIINKKGRVTWLPAFDDVKLSKAKSLVRQIARTQYRELSPLCFGKRY